MVRSWFEAGRGPASPCSFAASKLDVRPNFSSLQVRDQLRTSFEPHSVMEFGFNEQRHVENTAHVQNGPRHDVGDDCT